MAGKIVPDLSEQSAPIEDADLLVSYRGSGPLKRFAASVLKTYVQAGVAMSAVLAASGGSALVGFIQSGTGAVLQTLQAFLRLFHISPKSFGAVGDGVANDTAAVQAALDEMLASGRPLDLGNAIYSVTALTLNMTGTVPFVLSGSGQRVSVLRKRGSSGSPVLTVSGTTAASNLAEIRSIFSNFSIDVNGQSCDGIKLENVARFCFDQFETYDSTSAKTAIGMNVVGSLTGEFIGFTASGLLTGMKCRKSVTNTYYPNALALYEPDIRSCVTGLDFGDGAALRIVGGDWSGNGTATVTTTGAIIIRSTAATESGAESITMDDLYLEGNFGTAITVENAVGLALSIKNSRCLSQETIGGVKRVAVIGTVKDFRMENVTAAGATDTVTIAATASTVDGCFIGVITDTSAAQNYTMVRTSAGLNWSSFKGAFKRQSLATQDFLLGRADQISGGGADDLDYYLYGTGEHRFTSGGVMTLRIGANALGFYGTAPAVKQTVTGSSAGAKADSIAAALAATGLVTNSAVSSLSGSATYDPPSLADGTGATTTVTVTGAALGDFASSSFSLDLQGITVNEWVSAANTVSVRFQNETGGTIDLASGTLRARVDKA